MDADREVVVSVQGVTKAFGATQVLRGVDLEVRAAENVVVLGRSGSGKSVLIKIIVALLRPERGKVVVFGEDVHRCGRKSLDALRRRIGFSFQHSALYDSLTVAQNLAFPLTLDAGGEPHGEVAERVQAALDAVGLSASGPKMPHELSGGQRKRIGIARTLILRPEIMLYDEPTAGLDPITSAEINDLINEVRHTYHTASIIITHDLTCARTTGDRVAMLADGQILRTGSFDDVFESEDPRVKGFYDYNFMQPHTP